MGRVKWTLESIIGRTAVCPYSAGQHQLDHILPDTSDMLLEGDQETAGQSPRDVVELRELMGSEEQIQRLLFKEIDLGYLSR